MTPKKITEVRTKTITYWTCCIEKHRHTAESTALRCIAKHTEEPKPRTKKWTRELYKSVLSRYEAGERMEDIGKELSVSYERIRQAVAKARRIEVLEKDGEAYRVKFQAEQAHVKEQQELRAQAMARLRGE
jgi:Zn-dependent M32 family carboxypeptidase